MFSFVFSEAFWTHHAHLPAVTAVSTRRRGGRDNSPPPLGGEVGTRTAESPTNAQMMFATKTLSYGEFFVAADLLAERMLSKLRNCFSGEDGWRSPVDNLSGTRCPPVVAIALSEATTDPLFLPLLQVACWAAGLVIVCVDLEDPRAVGMLAVAEPSVIVVPDKVLAEQGARKLLERSEGKACCQVRFLLTETDIRGAIEDGIAQGTVVGCDRGEEYRFKLVGVTEGGREVSEEEDEDREEDRRIKSFVDGPSHLFFTSGSTGFPKGVMCTRKGLLTYCKWRNAVFKTNGAFSDRSSESDRRGNRPPPAKNPAAPPTPAELRRTAVPVDEPPQQHCDQQFSVVYVASSALFDPSLGDFFATLHQGARLVVAPSAIRYERMAEILVAERVTHVLTTPAVWTAGVVRSSVWAAAAGTSALADIFDHLDMVALGGEPIPQAIVRQFFKGNVRTPRLLNMYGVTECTVYQAFHEVRSEEEARFIDLPVMSEENDEHQLCFPRFAFSKAEASSPLEEVTEVGGKGELWIVAQDMVGWGYVFPQDQDVGTSSPKTLVQRLSFANGEPWGWHAASPALADKDIRPLDASAPALPHRRFRTGDIAQLVSIDHEVKVVKFLGRLDTQVKINGQRVDLAEIETVLLEKMSTIVKDMVVVLAAGTSDESQQLVGFLQIDPARFFVGVAQVNESNVEDGDRSSMSINKRRSNLVMKAVAIWMGRRHLPTHMVPSKFFVVEGEFPITATGKVARRVLKKIAEGAEAAPAEMGLEEEERDEYGQSAESRLTSLERAIVDVWSEFLPALQNNKFLSPLINLVELGADSLRVMRISRAMAEKFSGKDEIDDSDDGGRYGERLGVFAPKELLARPVLRDFARYLSKEGGIASGTRWTRQSPERRFQTTERRRNRRFRVYHHPLLPPESQLSGGERDASQLPPRRPRRRGCRLLY